MGKVIDCVSRINTGGKYDSQAFQKSVGLNGVGTKAVNALSDFFKVQSIRDGKTKVAEFRKGVLVQDEKEKACDLKNGTIISFTPDESIFNNFHFKSEFIENQLWNYVYLNIGLKIYFNGQKFESEKGLYDLLSKNLNDAPLYPIIHLREGKDLEVW